jgi:hypothetical protein
MLFIFAPAKRPENNIFVRNINYMKIKSFITIAAVLCFAILSFGCGGGAKNTSNTTANKPANVTNTTNTASTSTASANNSSTSNTEIAKADTSEPATGVAECDEYIKKYEACLTTIAAKNPQVAPAMKSSFEAQRNGFKTAASTPQGRTTLVGACKQAMDTAKTSTAQWCTNW